MAWRAAVVAAGLAFLAAGGAARAGDLEFYTGETLYAQCSAAASLADHQVREARCGGYVLGVSDAIQAAQGSAPGGKVCLPATATSTQLMQSVARFLDAHSDKRRLAAQDLVIEALSADFPCK